MDPLTIGAFLASAGSKILGGFLGSDAADVEARAARQSYKVERFASQIRDFSIRTEARAAREAAGLEWRAGLLDIDAANLEAEAITASSAVDYFNVLVDAENTARAFEADAAEGEFNARVARQMAKNSIAVADAEARDFRLRGNAAIESQAALQAGSGFMLEGSPMLVQDVLFGEVELGAARLKHAGEVEATRFVNQAQLLEYGAEVNTINAEVARQVGQINADYVKEAGRIRLDAAFLNGDRAILKLEGSLLDARTAAAKAGYMRIANRTALLAARIQTDALAKGASISGTSSIIEGFGSGFNTIASSGVFG